MSSRPIERRRYPRVAVVAPVSLEDAAGRTWHGESVNASPGGLKVKTDARLQLGCHLRVGFALPDGGPGITTTSLVIRRDPDGLAVSFVDLDPEAFERLQRAAASFRILLVEDDARVREMLAHALVFLGHGVFPAASGREGLARLATEGAIDLVMTDVAMPDMSGWEVAKVVKARWPHLRVGLITGTPEALLSQRGESIDFVLFKPVTLDALREAVSGGPHGQQ
jgi:CheY-like chemotaxis protein